MKYKVRIIRVLNYPAYPAPPLIRIIESTLYLVPQFPDWLKDGSKSVINDIRSD
jgi:hypothetical protein